MTTVFRNVAPVQPEPLAARRERMRRLLTGADGATALLLSVLLSLAIAQFLFSTGFLLGDTPFWQRTDHDIAQYLAGFNAYVREPWQWPLLRLTSINAPEGTLITFLDGVPLYALLLKLWQHGPDTPFRNPFAAWIVICFALQGVGAWWICREAQLRSWLALGVMVLLLAVFAPLSFRINHISLMSQWLILMGLAIYLRGIRLERLASGAWVALLLVAFYINTYLFSMVGLLFAAALLRQLGNSGAGARRHALLTALAAGGLLALSAGALLLPMGGGGGGGEWGFGFYSMNLLSPFSGGRLLQFTNAYGTDGQGEGYAYVGVFVLAAAAWALQRRRSADPTFWRRHRALAAILVFMTCFAISNVVFLGTVELFRLNLPSWMLGIASAVRSSGRFFWPVGYALTAFTVITLYRYLPQRRAAAALLVLLCLHLWDLGPHRKRVSESVNVGVHPRLNAEQWNQFFGPQVKQLQVYPPFGCQRAVPTETLLPTMLYAVRQHMAVSTGYVARVKRPCDNYAQEISSHTTPASGFVFLKQDFPELEAVHRLFGATAPSCVAADFAWLCKRAIPDLTENKQ